MIAARAHSFRVVLAWVVLGALASPARAQDAGVSLDAGVPTGDAALGAPPLPPPDLGAVPPPPPDVAPVAPPGYVLTPAPQYRDPERYAPPAAPPVVEDDSERDIRELDAQCDRVIFIPTAETMPAGTVAFSIYELVVLRLAYAVSDDVLFDAILFALGPFIDDTPYFIEVGAKWAITRGESFRAALLGAISTWGDERESVYAFRAMGMGQLCFSPTCQQSLTFAGLFGHLEVDRGFQLAGAALGLLARFSRIASFTLEPAVLVPLEDGDESLPLLSYGIRLGRESWALDIAFVRPLIEDIDLPAPGFPIATFTYRTGGRASSPADGSTPAPGGGAPGPAAAMGLVADWLRESRW